MTLVRFEPLRDLEHLSNKIQSLFNDYTTDFSFNPRIDICEDENKIYIDVEAAGVKKEDVKITLEDNILTITGEKKKETEDKKSKNYYRSERVFGTFTRSFTLPSEINRDTVDARFDDGILKVAIEKASKKPVTEKKIQIK